MNKNGFENNNLVKYLIIGISQNIHIFTHSLQNILSSQQLRKKVDHYQICHRNYKTHKFQIRYHI